MPKSQVDSTGLLVAVVALAVTLTLLAGPFLWLGSICGLALVFLILGFDRESYRTGFESLGFSAVVALSLTEAVTVIFRVLEGSFAQPAPIEGRIGSEWMPAIWLFFTLVFWPIDRARMSGRVQQPVARTSTLAPVLFSPSPMPPTPPPPAVPEPPRPIVREPVAPQPAAPAPTPPAPAQAAVSHPATSLRATFTQPAFAEAVHEPAAGAPYIPPPTPPPAYAPPSQPVQSQPVQTQPPPAYAPPAPASVAPAPVPQPIAVPSGKETMIYVTLVGEGLNVLRAVRAEHLGRDYYKIVDEMPEGETWQYRPGQVVRCKKKNLSSGKAMVATEEAQRAG